MKHVVDSTDGSGMTVTVDDRHPKAEPDQVTLVTEVEGSEVGSVTLGMMLTPMRARHLAQVLIIAAESVESREARA